MYFQINNTECNNIKICQLKTSTIYKLRLVKLNLKELGADSKGVLFSSEEFGFHSEGVEFGLDYGSARIFFISELTNKILDVISIVGDINFNLFNKLNLNFC